MAYNYNFNPQSVPSPTPQQMPQAGQNVPMMNVPQQNVQPLFPQPQGNVYNINSTLEVANVPVGAGLSVALCLPEGAMYIKTMQNGNPLFYPYKIVPYSPTNEDESNNQQATNEQNQIEKMAEQIKKCMDRISQLEESLAKTKKKGDDWNI